ncbi:MAG: RNA-binding domain-containing protein [Desulfurococcaceae archaeon]
MLKVIVEAEIRPSEDPEKVKRAILNIIETENILIEELGNGYYVMRALGYNKECLRPLRNAIRTQQIEPAFRSYLERYRHGESIAILLHKQASYVGKISLIDSEKESPLGPIKLIITGDDDELNEIVEYLTAE